MAQQWYAFKNTSDKKGEVELFVYNDIGGYGVTADKFAAELRKYKGQHIHLRINSLGGEVTEGNGIYNALTRHQGGVTVHIDGIAASMASVIAMAGTQVRMADNAILMIHNPWTIAAGESGDLRKQADVLDLMKDGIVGAYQKKTGLEANVISDMMDEERWLKAEEAHSLGFVDVIEEGVEAAASVGEWRSRFDKFAKAMSHKGQSSENNPEVATLVTELTSVTPQVDSEPVVETAVEEVTPVVEAPAPVAEEAAPAVEETTAVEETKEEAAAPEVVSPVAKADHEFAAALLKVSADRDAFKAQLDEAKASEAVAKAEAAELREQMQAKDVLHNALKRSLGIAAAVEVPAVPAGEPINLVEQLNKLSGADRTEFFRKHRAEIIKQNKH
jgi:ATP-dependent protease ClpP protease subunit